MLNDIHDISEQIMMDEKVRLIRLINYFHPSKSQNDNKFHFRFETKLEETPTK